MKRLLQRFSGHESGATATVFALALVPVLAVAGAAIDYTRAAHAKSELQAAVDSTAIMLARDAGKLSDAQMTARGQTFFTAMLKGRIEGDVAPIKVSRNAKTIVVSASATQPTAMMKILNVDEMALGADSTVAWGIQQIELALVLDNTGSMASNNKLTELKKAANNLLKTLAAAKADPDQIKVSLVPFATQVNVGTAAAKTAKWLDFDYTPAMLNYGADAKRKTTPAKWQGCVSDRDESFNVSAAPAVLSSKNSGSSSLYPAQTCQYGTLAQSRPLTSDFGTLSTAIDAMVANGNTNLTVGIAHGLATLTPASADAKTGDAMTPYSGAQAFGTKNVQKFMILLTDGDNTEDRFTSNVGAINARTTAACNAVKDTAKGVKLYTIRVLDGNAGLLQSCATNTGMYYNVTSAAQLDPVFQSIAGEITGIRLTQ